MDFNGLFGMTDNGFNPLGVASNIPGAGSPFGLLGHFFGLDQNQQNPSVPGPIGGFAGGTFNMDGSQATPVQRLPQNGADLAEPGQDVVVDGWKPKKRSTLGTIADMLLGAPIFANKVKQENVHNAMEGFTNDPLNTIRRIAQIPGMEQDAYKMYQSYADDKRADESAASLRDQRSKGYLTRIGGMLNSVRSASDPNKAYATMLPTIRRLAQRWNVADQVDLPDQWDDDAVTAQIMGSVDPDDQIRMEALKQNRQATQELNREKFESQDEYRKARLGQFDEANAIRRDKAARTNGDSLKKMYGGRAFKDPNGSLVEFNKEGTGFKVTDKTGNVINMFKIGPDGKKVHIKTMTKAEYDAMIAAAKQKASD